MKTKGGEKQSTESTNYLHTHYTHKLYIYIQYNKAIKKDKSLGIFT